MCACARVCVRARARVCACVCTSILNSSPQISKARSARLLINFLLSFPLKKRKEKKPARQVGLIYLCTPLCPAIPPPPKKKNTATHSPMQIPLKPVTHQAPPLSREGRQPCSPMGFHWLGQWRAAGTWSGWPLPSQPRWHTADIHADTNTVAILFTCRKRTGWVGKEKE